MIAKSAVFALLALCLATRSSSAATASTSMSVSVVVEPGCVASPTSMPYGSYIAGKWKAESVVEVVCNNQAPHILRILAPADPIGPTPIPGRHYWPMQQTHGSGLVPGTDTNFDHVTIGVDRSNRRRFISAMRSSDSVIIVVTY